MDQNKRKQKKIIVTGASAGLGSAICREIAREGGIPIMLARSSGKLERMQETLEKEFGISAPVYTVDLRSLDGLQEDLDKILREQGRVHGLINNAGVGVFKNAIDLTEEEIDEMIDLNVRSAIFLSTHLLKHFNRQEQGHFVMIASQAAKISTPKSAVYGATKQALLGFSNGLRQEVEHKSIYVTTVNLGPVNTNFFEKADPSGNYKESVKKYMLEPDIVAAKIVKHLFTAKREINMPMWMEAGSIFYRLFPGLMEKVLQSQFRKK